jgi:hypothetical protein
MRIRVEFHPDEHGRRLPRAIYFDSRRIEVAEAVDQWYGPDHRYVKLRSCDGDTYILKYDETRADWDLTMFERA